MQSAPAPLEQATVAPGTGVFGARTRLVMVGTVGYLAAASLHAVSARGAWAWLVSLVALGIAWGAGVRERARGVAEWGVALAVASFAAPAAEGWVAASGLLGALVTALAANGAIAEVAAPVGLAHRRKASPLFGRVVLGALLGAPLLSSSLRAVGVSGAFAGEARLLSSAGCLFAGSFLLGLAWDTARVRSLELGVAPRMIAAVGLGAATGTAALAVWSVGTAPGEALARVALALGALLVCHVCRGGDPVRLARASRRVVALTIVGGPVLLLGATMADGRPWDVGAIVAVFGVVALAIGACASFIEEPLRPARGAWLDAVVVAHQALLGADPDEAVREALVALRAPAGLSAASPQLWTFDPPHVTTVDAAGYSHGGAGALPEGLVALAASEPETILRSEVLDALAVRRPELRPFASWMAHQGAMLAVVVARIGEAEGLLVLPRGKRHEPLSLEEARAIRQLAGGMAALCHSRSALARSLARERTATVRAEQAEASLAPLTREVEGGRVRHALAAERLARPATAGIYSAVARFAYDALGEIVSGGRSCFVHAPGGIDAVPFVARAHLEGPRRDRPLVVVEGTSTREHDAARWADADVSPLALADRGLLLLVDVGALPPAVQELVGRAHAEERAPWGAPLSFALAVTSRAAFPDLVGGGRLDPALAKRFADEGVVSLPRLRDRPEDLRAIVGDRLAREGLRVRGVPVGIEDAAFRRLLDHPFEGEDAELSALVLRLVAACVAAGDDVVRARHVDALLGGSVVRPAPDVVERTS